MGRRRNKKIGFGVNFLTVCLCLLASTCWAETLSQYKGYLAIQTTLEQRLFKSNSGVELGSYLGESFFAGNMGLLVLLGVYQQEGAKTVLVNGDPNGTSFLIWYLLMDGLSDDLAKLCSPQQSSIESLVSAEFLQKVKPLCAWPNLTSRDEQTFLDFWTAIAFYDLPFEEFEAWRDFYLDDAFKNESPAVVIKSMALSILMNPHFLIK